MGTFAFGGTLLAQGPPGGGGGGGGGGGYVGISKRFDFGNARYGVDFTGTDTDGTNITTLGQNLSGTNVEFTLLVSIIKLGVPAMPPPPLCTASTITDIKVYILGSGVDDTMPDQLYHEDIPAGASQKYRLSSTYFAAGASINIRVTATFAFTHESYEGRTSTVFPYDQTFNFTACNFTARVGTKLNGDGTEDPIFTSVSTGILAQSAKLQNHFRQPTSVLDALVFDKAPLLALIVPSTAFVSASHGDQTFVYDSFAVSQDANHVILAVNQAGGEGINVEVAAKAASGIPGYNLLVFYSCWTLAAGGGASSITAGFGIGGADRAHLGFDGKVNNFLKAYGSLLPSFTETLDIHAYRLFTALSEGKTVGEAMAYAQSEEYGYVPCDTANAFADLPMRTPSDPWTRTWFVYLTQAERIYLDSKGQTFDRHFVKLPVTAHY